MTIYSPAKQGSKHRSFHSKGNSYGSQPHPRRVDVREVKTPQKYTTSRSSIMDSDLARSYVGSGLDSDIIIGGISTIRDNDSKIRSIQKPSRALNYKIPRSPHKRRSPIKNHHSPRRQDRRLALSYIDAARKSSLNINCRDIITDRVSSKHVSYAAVEHKSSDGDIENQIAPRYSFVRLDSRIKDLLGNLDISRSEWDALPHTERKEFSNPKLRKSDLSYVYNRFIRHVNELGIATGTGLGCGLLTVFSLVGAPGATVFGAGLVLTMLGLLIGLPLSHLASDVGEQCIEKPIEAAANFVSKTARHYRLLKACKQPEGGHVLPLLLKAAGSNDVRKPGRKFNQIETIFVIMVRSLVGVDLSGPAAEVN